MLTTNSKYKLAINRIELSVTLGWLEEERQTPQSVYLDMLIEFPKLPEACLNDELTGTICYQTLIVKLRAHLHNSSHRLIERLGYVIYEFVKKSLPHDCILHVTLTKYPVIECLHDGCSFYFSGN